MVTYKTLSESLDPVTKIRSLFLARSLARPIRISGEFAESELYQWEVYFVSFVCASGALFELYVSYVLDDFILWL